MADQEQVEFTIEPRSVTQALGQMNNAITSYEKGATGANERLNNSFQRVSDLLLKVNDRSYNSQERLVKSIERQAQAYGRTGVEKLIAQRDSYIKRLGDEESQIKRVTAAYEKMIKAEQAGGAGSGQEAQKGFLAAKDLFEGRNAYASVEAGKTLLALQGFPAVAGAAAAGVAVVGTAVYEMTKRFTESSESLVSLSASTGIGINDLDRLKAMAALTATDIGTLARAGTEMAQTLDQGGEKSIKLTESLARIGVSTRSFNGAQRDEGALLVETLGHLANVTDKTERLALAAETLGPRTSRTLQPLIADYDALRVKVEELGYGTQEGLIRRGSEAAQTLHLLGLQIEQVERYVAAGGLEFVAFGEYAISALAPIKSELGGVAETLAPIITLLKVYADLKQAKVEAFKESPEYKQTKQMMDLYRQYTRVLDQVSTARATASARAFVTSIGGSEDAVKEDIKDQEKKRGDALAIINAAKIGGGVNFEVEKGAEQTFRSSDPRLAADRKNLELFAQRKELTKQLDELQRTAGQAELEGLEKVNAKWDSLIEKYRAAGYSRAEESGNEARLNQDRIKEIDSLNKKLDEQHGKEIRNIQINESRAMLRVKEQSQPEIQIKELGQPGVTEASITGQINAQAEQRRSNIGAEHDLELNFIKDIANARQKDTAIQQADSKQRIGLAESEVERQKQINSLTDKAHEQDLRFQQEFAKIGTASQSDDVKRRANFGSAVVDLAYRDDPMKAAQMNQAIRVNEANELTAIEIKRISAEETGDQAALSAARALKTLKDGIANAEEAALLKQMQLQQKQFDTIQKDAEGLFNTLFTKPAEFGKQLAATVKAAFLKPITEGLSNTVAAGLRPVIYGQDGNGGIAGSMKGLFAKPTDPISASADLLKGATDINSIATDRNTDALSRFIKSREQPPTPSGPAAAVASSTETHLRRIAESTERSEATSTQAPSAPGFFSGFPSMARTAALGMVGVMGMGGMAAPSFARPLTERVTSTFRPGTGMPSASSLGIAAPFSTPDVTSSLLAEPSGRGGFEGIAGGDSFSFPTSSASSSQMGVPTGVGGLASIYGENPSAFLGPGGTSGFAGPMGGVGGFSGGDSTNPAGAILGGVGALIRGGQSSTNGGGITGGIKGILGSAGSAFGSATWGGIGHNIGTMFGGNRSVDSLGGTWATIGNQSINTDTVGGTLSTLSKSPAAGTPLAGMATSGGIALAEAGLLGERRGTWGGVAEGAAGGFLVAGPIGAAVGFSIGVGEMLAGVESPDNKAIRLVKDLYRIDINRQMAKQIVSIADSKYATNINLAIRDPQVRQMMGLYAQGTGQGSKFPLSASAPSGASLVEQGGQLYQAQTYQYGVGRVMQSSLPVAGGGNPQVVPNPGPTYVSLNFDGKNAGDAMTGQFVTPSFVQGQFSASQMASNGRVANAALSQQPGLIVS